jgi:hypothetical protein
MVGWDVVGPVAIIAIIGAVYYYFNKVDADKANKDADVHIKRVGADVEMEKLKVQQKELELKREFFEFEREKLQPRLGDSIKAEYKVRDLLEDKSEPEIK